MSFKRFIKRFDPLNVLMVAAILALLIGAGVYIYVRIRMDNAFTHVCNSKGGTSIIIKETRMCLKSQSVIEVVQ